MKKITSVLLVLLAVLTVTVGCGKSAGPTTGTADVDDIKTVGDAFDLKSAEYETSGSYGNKYAYGFSLNGTFYRVVATMTEDEAEQYYAVDIASEKREELEKAIVAPIKIDFVENLSERILTGEEIDKLVGKTGSDLFNNGWIINYSDTMSLECGVDYDLLEYTVTFEGSIEESDDEYRESEEIFGPLTVKSVKFSGLGDIMRDLEDN